MAHQPDDHYTPRRTTDTLVIHLSRQPRPGVHLRISEDGRVTSERPIWATGEHTPRLNATSVGMHVVGSEMTREQEESLVRMVRGLLREYLITEVLAVGFDAKTWLRQHKREVSE